MAHRTSGVMAIFFGLILAAIPAFAHHSLNAEFQMGKPTELKGTLTKVEWDNPHVYWDVDVKDAGRQRGHWSVEGLPRATYTEAASTDRTLSPWSVRKSPFMAASPRTVPSSCLAWTS